MFEGFNEGLLNVQDGVKKAIPNGFIGLANSATDHMTGAVIGDPTGLTLNYRHGYWSNPFAITPIAYRSQRAAEIGSAVFTGIAIGATKGAGVFAAESGGVIAGITNEFRDFRRAEIMRDALKAQYGAEKAMYIGGYNSDGQVAAGFSSKCYGCAENMVRAKLGPDVQFTNPIGFRRNNVTNVREWGIQPVCLECQTKYRPSQFPVGQTAKPGGAWGQ